MRRRKVEVQNLYYEHITDKDARARALAIAYGWSLEYAYEFIRKENAQK